MAPVLRGAVVPLGGSGASVTVTSRSDGDRRPGPGGSRTPGRTRGWTFARQVHGTAVHVVESPPQRWHARSGPPLFADGPPLAEADALVSAAPEVCLAVLGADCALVGLASPDGVVGVAHAGWRGLVAGVLGATVACMRRLGAGGIEAVLGPCIHPECYAFGRADLEDLAAALGPGVVATTADGKPAFDLPAGVRVALAREGVELVGTLGGCTACGGDWFSHRARQDAGRQALAVSRSADLLNWR